MDNVEDETCKPVFQSSFSLFVTFDIMLGR